MNNLVAAGFTLISIGLGLDGIKDFRNKEQRAAALKLAGVIASLGVSYALFDFQKNEIVAIELPKLDLPTCTIDNYTKEILPSCAAPPYFIPEMPKIVEKWNLPTCPMRNGTTSKLCPAPYIPSQPDLPTCPIRNVSMNELCLAPPTHLEAKTIFEGKKAIQPWIDMGTTTIGLSFLSIKQFVGLKMIGALATTFVSYQTIGMKDFSTRLILHYGLIALGFFTAIRSKKAYNSKIEHRDALLMLGLAFAFNPTYSHFLGKEIDSRAMKLGLFALESIRFGCLFRYFNDLPNMNKGIPYYASLAYMPFTATLQLLAFGWLRGC